MRKEHDEVTRFTSLCKLTFGHDFTQIDAFEVWFVTQKSAFPLIEKVFFVPKTMDGDVVGLSVCQPQNEGA